MIQTLLVIALLARLLGSDRTLATEWLFHIPLVIVAVGALALVSLWWPRRRTVAVMASVAAIASLLSLHLEQPRLFPRAKPVSASGGGSRAVTMTAWNVMSYNYGPEKIANLFAGDDADIVCLLEGTYRRQAPDFLHKRLGKSFKWAGTRQMAVGSRLPIREAQESESPSGVRTFRVVVKAPSGRDLTVLLVDVPRPPRMNTDAIFEDLWAEIATLEPPFVVVGDFNTPRGSAHLSRATANLKDMFLETPGAGWLATWHARYLPLYQIDHAFASQDVTPVSANVAPEVASDHLRLRLAFKTP